MAQRRMISRSLGCSDKFTAVPDIAGKSLAEFAQLLFCLMIPHVDDWGRMSGSPKALKLSVHPSSPRPVADFDAALDHLHTARLIDRYRISDTEVIQILNFEREQPGLRLDRRTKSRWPDNAQNTEEKLKCLEVPGDAGKIPAMPESSSSRARAEGKGSEGKGSDQKGKEQEGNHAAAPLTPHDLMTLWNERADRQMPKVAILTPQRQKTARVRIQEHPSCDWWATYLARITASDVLMGRAPRDEKYANWRPDFDWALKPGTVAKVLEGKYDNRGASAPGRTGISNPSVYDRTTKGLPHA